MLGRLFANVSVFGVLVAGGAFIVAGGAIMPPTAVAQNNDPGAQKDLDALKDINGKLDRLKELDAKGSLTEKENDEKKELDKAKDGLEKRKTKIEEGLDQALKGSQQGVYPLSPGMVQKIKDYFELKQAKADLEAEEKKGDKANKKKIERLKKRIATLEGTTAPPTKDDKVKTATGISIVDGECDDPKCTLGR